MEEHTNEYWLAKYKLWRVLHNGKWHENDTCRRCVSHMHEKGILDDNMEQRILRVAGVCPIRNFPRLTPLFLDNGQYILKPIVFVGKEDCVEWIKYE